MYSFGWEIIHQFGLTTVAATSFLEPDMVGFEGLRSFSFRAAPVRVDMKPLILGPLRMTLAVRTKLPIY